MESVIDSSKMRCGRFAYKSSNQYQYYYWEIWWAREVRAEALISIFYEWTNWISENKRGNKEICRILSLA